jgi:hypothetical protein
MSKQSRSSKAERHSYVGFYTVATMNHLDFLRHSVFGFRHSDSRRSFVV